MKIRQRYRKTNSDNKGYSIYREYLVEFSVKAYQELTVMDKEKIYRIQRIIDSLGNDDVEEETKELYRFTKDDDDEKHILDCVEIVSK